MTERCEPLQHRSLSVLCRLDSTRSAVQWAKAYLGCMHVLCRRPAIVLDIDGTVLLNNDQGAKCVLHFQALVAGCADAGIHVFAVTARPDVDRGSNRTWTERQLQKCGIAPIDRLFMRPPRAPYEAFKHRCRERIRAMGFTVLLSIGDQFADLSRSLPRNLDDHSVLVGTLGDNGAMAIKLPSEY